MRLLKLPLKNTSLLFLVLVNQYIYSQDYDLFNSDWNKVTITKWVSPEFDLSIHKNLIIAEILNEKNRKDNETQIIYNKIAGIIQQTGGVRLLDREKTEIILNEYKLQSTGIVEEDYVTSFGKFFSSGVIMIGRILNSDYKNELNTFKLALTNETRKYRKGIYTISFGFQFIDIATSQIIYSKTIDVKHFIETKPTKGSPAKVNENEVYVGCVNKLSEKFKNLITSHEVDYNIKFQKSSKFNTELKSVAALVQVQEFDIAHKKLIAILEDRKVNKNSKALSSAYYNLAILETYTDKYELAKSNAKQGYLKNPNNDGCLKLIKILQ